MRDWVGGRQSCNLVTAFGYRAGKGHQLSRVYNLVYFVSCYGQREKVLLELCRIIVPQQLDIEAIAGVLSLVREIKNANISVRASYMNVLKNNNLNWKTAYITAGHWSNGKREWVEDLPDINYFSQPLWISLETHLVN